MPSVKTLSIDSSYDVVLLDDYCFLSFGLLAQAKSVTN